ncbi:MULTISPECIES: SDR family NAD(P)-dependent oxidoreductase [Streptosporangium]|uniref:3-oxoacyl-[acyl-carrier protein] reductase n=1 Tax=Streptosporangium brasiliense TaxID=47480 RepID=A0ABT9R5L8_9ACTN|nr:SDR family NAD(P)-dependent oxidoreductase [Streptosporangium brasiliense]MDP9864537.1 3-oxoacyl-[acyl-carrier protein] reductase [Streptosporangium brasiliense]
MNEVGGQQPHYPDLAGKVALVTGGSRGIGAATCRALAANGVKVAVNGRDRAAVDAVVAGIVAAGGTAVAAPGDVTDEGAVRGIHDTVEHELGPVEVLAAFAGGQGAPAPTTELGADRWRAVIESDLTSVYLTVTAFLPGMIGRGGGSIITMSSTAGRRPSGANAAYAAAKAGVVMLTGHLANEVGRHGVRVNCLAPSAVLNDRMRRFMSAGQLEELAAAYPLGRIGRPDDVAQAVLYLASDASSWVTGVTLDLTGGRVIA